MYLLSLSTKIQLKTKYYACLEVKYFKHNWYTTTYCDFDVQPSIENIWFTYMEIKC